jgi:hypothetical protein
MMRLSKQKQLTIIKSDYTFFVPHSWNFFNVGAAFVRFCSLVYKITHWNNFFQTLYYVNFGCNVSSLRFSCYFHTHMVNGVVG